MYKRGSKKNKVRVDAMSPQGVDVKLYSRFKEYLSHNPDADKVQIVKDVGISGTTIDKYIKVMEQEGYYMKILRDHTEIEIEIKDDGTVYGIDTDGSRIIYDKFGLQDIYTKATGKCYMVFAGVYPEVRFTSLYDSSKPKRKCYATFFLSREQVIELLNHGVKIAGLMLQDEKLVAPMCYNHVFVEV